MARRVPAWPSTLPGGGPKPIGFEVLGDAATEWLSVTEAAHRSKTTRGAVRSAIQTGRLPAVRIPVVPGWWLWMIDPASLRTYDARRPSARLAVAEAFLRALLQHGPVRATEGHQARVVAGIALRTLEKAKHRLGVQTRYHGRPCQPGSGYLWYPPRIWPEPEVKS